MSSDLRTAKLEDEVASLTEMLQRVAGIMNQSTDSKVQEAGRLITGTLRARSARAKAVEIANRRE